jgi:hypothetical protein
MSDEKVAMAAMVVGQLSDQMDTDRHVLPLVVAAG